MKEENGQKKLQIRNSTAEFLIFQLQNKEEGVEVLWARRIAAGSNY